MLNCHDATRLMSESQERKLSIGERMSLKLHLMMCCGCQNCKDQLDTLRVMMRTYAKKQERAGKEVIAETRLLVFRAMHSDGDVRTTIWQPSQLLLVWSSAKRKFV